MIDVELLRWEALTGLIQSFKPENLQFTAAGILPRREGLGQTRTWDILGTDRDLDTFEGKMSPAGTRRLQVIGQRSASLARTFKSVYVPGAVLIDLRNPGTVSRQRVAQDIVGRETKAQGAVIDRQNEFMIARALQGSIAMTIDGIAHTVDYGFPAGHVIAAPGGAIVPVAWSDAAADIIEDVRLMKRAVARDSGRMATRVYTSTQVITWLMKNDFIAQQIQGSPLALQTIVEGKLARFLALEWVAVDGTFTDSGGTVTNYVPENHLIMTPEPSEEWGYFDVGSDVIPTDDKKNIQEVVGRYEYSTINENPASIALYAGEVRLPIIRIPNALFNANVAA